MKSLKPYYQQFEHWLATNPPYLQLLVKIGIVVVVVGLLLLVNIFIVKLFKKKLDAHLSKRVHKETVSALKTTLSCITVFIAGSGLIHLLSIKAIQPLFYALMIILIATPVRHLITIVLEYLHDMLVSKTQTKFDDIVFDLLLRFSGAIVYAVAIILALDFMGVNVIPFITGAGILGVAVGFAAKDTLSNLIAGVLLIIDRPFEIGDRVEVWSAPKGSSTWGDVIDIGLRATKIKTTDNLIIVIPNNEIMKRDIVNYTILSEKIRVRINLSVGYDADIKLAKELAQKAALQVSWVLEDPPPKVVVRNFGESSVDLQLRVWIGNARKRMDTISTITDLIKTAYHESGVEIPYPRRRVTVVKEIQEAEEERKTLSAL